MLTFTNLSPSISCVYAVFTSIQYQVVSILLGQALRKFHSLALQVLWWLRVGLSSLGINTCYNIFQLCKIVVKRYGFATLLRVNFSELRYSSRSAVL